MSTEAGFSLCIEIIEDEGSCSLFSKKQVEDWWVEVGGEREFLSASASDYFVNTFTTQPSGNILFRKFSTDGINLIPSLFRLQRQKSLDLTRKVFDKFCFSSQVIGTVASFKSDLTKDEQYILEYVGGFILHKLLKRCSIETHINLLKSLMDFNSNFSSYSLISCFNNSAYGYLTVPKKCIVNLLSYLEIKFRELYQSENISEKVISSLDKLFISSVISSIVFSDKAAIDTIIFKIIKFFLKIRCYQKAKKLNSTLKLHADKTISLRKSLK
ncbi:uncharacterized protein LOC108950619 [Ciona intestinalis]